MQTQERPRIHFFRLCAALGIAAASLGVAVSSLVVRASGRTESADKRALSVAVVGDWGTAGRQQKKVASGMALWAASNDAKAVVSVGDNFYPSGVQSVSDKMFNTHYESIYTSPSLHVPWIVALGNHDHRGSVQAQIDYTRRSKRWIMPARYYTHTVADSSAGDVFFIVLDTTPFLQSAQEAERQTAFADSAAAASTARWKVIVVHHPMRSNSHYGDTKVLIKKIKPVAERHGIRLVLAGHDHDLQINRGDGDEFISVVSGAGGGLRKSGRGSTTLFQASTAGFVGLRFFRDSLRVAAVDSEGKELYTTSIAHPRAQR